MIILSDALTLIDFEVILKIPILKNSSRQNSLLLLPTVAVVTAMHRASRSELVVVPINWQSIHS